MISKYISLYCSGLTINNQPLTPVTYLDRFGLLLFDQTPDEAVQHGLEQVDHQRHLRQPVGAGQPVHLVVVTFQQVYVADVGLLLKMRQILDLLPSTFYNFLLISLKRNQTR